MSGKTMMCRCEDLTLADIEHAYEEGNRDIESLKRYTGFGTGWCQGKQCLLLCARFLASKTGSFPEEPMTPRPPIHPMPLGLLARLGSDGSATENREPADREPGNSHSGKEGRR